MTSACEICGEPMPKGEEMFKYHGYSGECPKPVMRHREVRDERRSRVSLNQLAKEIHEDNRRWWHTEEGERLKRNKGELLMLIVSEIAEAMEGERKDKQDDHLPHRLSAEVELADALIRIFDYAGAFGYDIDGAMKEKREYNRVRVDHSYEARRAEGGKKF